MTPGEDGRWAWRCSYRRRLRNECRPCLASSPRQQMSSPGRPLSPSINHLRHSIHTQSPESSRLPCYSCRPSKNAILSLFALDSSGALSQFVCTNTSLSSLPPCLFSVSLCVPVVPFLPTIITVDGGRMPVLSLFPFAVISLFKRCLSKRAEKLGQQKKCLRVGIWCLLYWQRRE